MSFAAKKLAVTGDATAVVVYSNPAGGPAEKVVTVEVNNTSANSVYLGGSSATTDGTNGAGAAASNAGRTVATLTAKSVTLLPGDSLYIFAHTTSTVEVNANGQ